MTKYTFAHQHDAVKNAGKKEDKLKLLEIWIGLCIMPVPV